MAKEVAMLPRPFRTTGIGITCKHCGKKVVSNRPAIAIQSRIAHKPTPVHLLWDYYHIKCYPESRAAKMRGARKEK